jgi:methylglyoxal synthase
MSARKAERICLIAHDARKMDLVDWVKNNQTMLEQCKLWATKSTGELIALETGLPITCLLSGPYGGDSQVGTMIAEQKLDLVVFFWDPLSPQPHDVDVKALLRLAVLHNVPIACNRATADMLISSSMF